MVKVKHPQAKTMKVDNVKNAKVMKDKPLQKPNKNAVKANIIKGSDQKVKTIVKKENPVPIKKEKTTVEDVPISVQAKVAKVNKKKITKTAEVQSTKTIIPKKLIADVKNESDNKQKSGDTDKKGNFLQQKIRVTTFKAPEVLVSTELIVKAVHALKTGTAKLSNTSKKLFGNEFRYGLQLRTTKVPECPKRNARMSLTHPLITSDDSICLLVKDDIPGKKSDYEKTVAEYRELLNTHNLGFIKNIIPFGQLKKEYKTFELKRKLANSYDMFLVDARINDNVFGFLGKAFIARRKNPTPVILNKTENIEKEIKKGLNKVIYKMGNGAIVNIDVATDRMTEQQFVDNIEKVLANLKTSFPGGYENIQSIHLIPQNQAGLVIPLYFSSANPNEIAKPIIPGPKKTKIIKMKAKMSELSTRYTVDSKGKIVKKKNNANKDQKKPKNKTIIKPATEDFISIPEVNAETNNDALDEVEVKVKVNKNKNIKKRKISELNENTESQVKTTIVNSNEKKSKVAVSGKNTKTNKSEKKLKSKQK